MTALIFWLVGSVITFVGIMLYCYFWSKKQEITWGDVILAIIVSMFSWVTIGVIAFTFFMFSIDWDKPIIKRKK
jgi:hypothetical protein